MRLAWAVPVLLVAALLAGCSTTPEAVPAPPPPPAARTDAWALAGDPALEATVRLLPVGHDFYEPAFGITPKGTWAVCCVVDNATGRDATLVSTDQGGNWSVAHTALAPSFDPMLATDPATGRIFELNMVGVSCSDLAFSDDEGATWTERPASCAVPYYDYLKLAAGRPGPEPNPLAGATYPSVLYQCRNVNVPPFVGTVLSNWCAVSYDGGLTWPIDREVAARTRGAFGTPPAGDVCAGVTGFPTIGPDGTAVLPVGNGCDTFLLGVSRDSGLTWTTATGPAGLGIESATPEAAFDAAGHLYLLWQDGNATMRLARSDDLGATWTEPWVVNPPGVRGLAFEAMESGAEGRLAFAILGSQAQQEGIGGVGDNATWDLYVLTAEDAHTDAPRIAAYRANPADDPVQVGPVCFGGSGCTRNLGDFFTSARSTDGTFHLAFSDGCVGCGSEPGADSAGFVAVLDGWTLDG